MMLRVLTTTGMMALTLAGCVEVPDTQKQKLASAIGTVSGRVVDAMTREGIAGVAVSLQVDGEWRDTTSADDESPTDPRETRGDFVFPDVPVGNHRLAIAAEGYAVRHMVVAVGTSNDNSPVSVDLLSIPVERAFSLTVYVSSEGTPVEGATVMASSGYTGYSELYRARTDGGGAAVIGGLPQNQPLTLMVPAFDQNGDGVYDWQSSLMVEYTRSTDSDSAVHIELVPARRDDAIEIIDHNLDAPNREGAIDKDQALVMVFNYPILPDSPGDREFTLTFDNTHVPVDQVGFGDRVEVPVSIEYSMGNTVLTVRPQAPLIINQDYTLNGMVNAVVNGELQTLPVGESLYVYDDSSTGVASPSFDIQLDNFNGTTSDPDSLPGAVTLVFPEWVTGRIVVVSRTLWDGTINRTTVLNQPVDLETEGAFNNGLTGTGTLGGNFSGHRHLAVLSIQTPDHTSIFNATFVIEFDLVDAEGNRYFDTLTRNVQ